MGRIVSKLNLNKTPQLVESNSMIFAKNIKLLADGTIGPDDGMSLVYNDVKTTRANNLIGEIVGVNNKIYFFVEVYDKSNPIHIARNFPILNKNAFDPILYINNNKIDYLVGQVSDLRECERFLRKQLEDTFGIELACPITDDMTDEEIRNNIYYEFDNCIKDDINIYWSYKAGMPPRIRYYPSDRDFIIEGTGLNPKIKILEYDEQSGVINEIKSGWKYNGGYITGYVTVNNTNEMILTVCEYFNEDTDLEIPIKHINLSNCSETDDESIYTQTPNIPITNLNLVTTYVKTIPNGVYQFFVRYKIRDDFYTNWFPCSKECFAGVSQVTRTIQGELKHVDVHKDSSKSFIFSVEHIFDGINNNKDFTKNFKDYQLGFIISHDDSVNARSWKNFSFDVKEIYFDYNKNDIKEINIDDLLKSSYEIFNVKNITYFRNKLYISNYKETNFNPDFKSLAKNIHVTLKQTCVYKDVELSIGSQPISKSTGSTYYDRWGNQLIANLFDTEVYNTKVRGQQQAGTLTSDQATNGVYTAEAHLQLRQSGHNNNYVIFWIYKGETDANTPALDPKDKIKEFTAPNTTNVFDRQNNYLVDVGNGFKDTSKHPLTYYPSTRYKWYYITNIPGQPGNNGYSDTFIISNKWLTTDKEKAITNLKDNLFNAFDKTLYGTIIHSIYVISNNTPYFIYGDATTINTSTDKAYNFAGLEVTSGKIADTETLDAKVKDYVKEKIFAINPVTGRYYVKINNDIVEFDTYFVLYSNYTYDIKAPDTTDEGVGFKTTYRIDVTRKIFNRRTTISINERYLSNGYVESQYTSLMPFTSYEFYVHYVKNNGVITNGYLIAEPKPVNYEPKNDDFSTLNIIYPEFTNITIPEGYASCFISIYKTGDDICRGFNHQVKDGYHYLDCLEADTLLYKFTNEIEIIDSDGNKITNKDILAEYHESGSTSPITMFGNSGCVRWPVVEDDEYTDYDGFWLRINNKSESSDNHKSLIKITPYLHGDEPISYDVYKDMNLPAYATKVYKLDREAANAIYVSDTDVYNKTTSGTDVIQLTPNNSYLSLNPSNYAYVLSNFNLNYLSLSEDNIIKPKIRSFKSGESATDRQIIISVNSLTSSYALELLSMYRDYTRKYFAVYNDKQIRTFDNTIRSSDINVDEVYRNIYLFEAEDYYNIPTNRGIIINLFSIINNIFVHTEHSFYKFSGNNNLTTSDGEVNTKEGDVFDNGITEVFDSQYGHAGIQKKSHSLITYNSYVFYDKIANIIYAYGGEGQLMNIGEPIRKILDEFNLFDVNFVSDEYNDRFFIKLSCMPYESGQIGIRNIVLSYNFKSKSFISLHDFNFDYTFNGRTNVYFVKNTENQYYVYKYDRTIFNDYKKLFDKSYLANADMIYPFINDYSYKSPVVENCVEIIFNDGYEYIKVLEYINWICSEILSYLGDENYLAEENIDKDYAGTKLRIYSDQCSTELIELEDENGVPFIQNKELLSSPTSYKYPRYNCGVWTLNYFRDIRNDNDLYNYGGHGVIEDKSLIYGKYFVIRLIFKNRKFKLENIQFNVNNYGKT